MLHSLVLALGLVATDTLTAVGDTVRSEVEIRQAALRNAGDVRKCYEREGLMRDPALRGSLEVTVTILPTGQVEAATVAEVARSGEGMTEVRDCVGRAVKNWRFERGPFAVETIVFPFALSPMRADSERPQTNRRA